MARVEKVTCDVCGVLKQETNHWFILNGVDYSGIIIDNCSALGNYSDQASFIDLCGEACVIKKVSELIAKK
jgi:hypothetical protein